MAVHGELLSRIEEKVRARNVLRRSAGLPQLDLRRERSRGLHEQAISEDALMLRSGRRRLAPIEKEVEAEFRRRFGPQFGRSSLDRWAMRAEAVRRFRKAMAAASRQGLASP